MLLFWPASNSATSLETNLLSDSTIYCLLHLNEGIPLQNQSNPQFETDNNKMVIYSGFSTRRQQQKYNQMIKDLLQLLSQMIITYVQSSKAYTFRQSYEKLYYQFIKMDQHKYSDIKVSLEIQALTNHIISEDFTRETFSQPPKKKNQGKANFRTKRSGVEHIASKTIEIPTGKQAQDKRRSFSNNSDKKITRYLNSQDPIQQMTMQDLMRMNPLIQRKMSGYRKKRYIQSKNNFPQIKQEDYEQQQKQ